MKRFVVVFTATVIVMMGIVWASKTTTKEEQAVLVEVRSGVIVTQNHEGTIRTIKMPEFIDGLEINQEYAVEYTAKRWGRPVINSIKVVQ